MHGMQQCDRSWIPADRIESPALVTERRSVAGLPEVMAPRFEPTVPALEGGKIRGRSFCGAYRIFEALVNVSRILSECTIAGGPGPPTSESSDERSDEALFLA